MPAGTATATASLRTLRPCPAQTAHRARVCRPSPPHDAHGFENRMWPRAHCICPSALAFATGRFGNRHLAGAAARAAQDLARHQHLPLDAVHRISERDRDRRMQVDSDFGPIRACSRHRVQDFGEQLAERRCLCAAFRGGKIELREHERRRFDVPAIRPAPPCRTAAAAPDRPASRTLRRSARTSPRPRDRPG